MTQFVWNLLLMDEQFYCNFFFALGILWEKYFDSSILGRVRKGYCAPSDGKMKIGWKTFRNINMQKSFGLFRKEDMSTDLRKVGGFA